MERKKNVLALPSKERTIDKSAPFLLQVDSFFGGMTILFSREEQEAIAAGSLNLNDVIASRLSSYFKSF
jgi:hypothetical protein